MEARAHRVVVVGGGFGGLQAAKRLRRAPADLTLVDRRNFHLFQPLLYQVATGALSSGEIASPLRGVLRHDPRATVVLAEVEDIDLEGRRVMARELMADRRLELDYDTLIVAGGRPPFVLRARRVGAARAGPQVAGGRARAAAAHPRQLRGRRGRARPRAASAPG